MALDFLILYEHTVREYESDLLLKLELERRGYTTSYFATKEEAVCYLAGELKGKSVAFGGSVTLDQMNAYDVIGKESDVHWHWKGDSFCQNADAYIASANAVAETGEIVNIDGVGNRVAGTLFGSKEIYLVCGVNKIVPTLADALERAQNIAAPKNAVRIGCKTPCAAANGEKCFHCSSPAKICRATVILNGPTLAKDRYEIVLIGEELGY